MPRGATVQLYEAKESFVATIDGEITPVKKGQLFRADHPILKRREHLFKPTDMVRSEVEQATAAPGEKRGE